MPAFVIFDTESTCVVLDELRIVVARLRADACRLVFVSIHTAKNVEQSRVFSDVLCCLIQLRACVLAGGQSRRMGRDKALIPRADGRVWLTALIDCLLSMDLAVVVVSGHPGHQPYVCQQSRVSLLLEPAPWSGPLQALSHVLSIDPGDPLLVLPVDMPCLTSVVLHQLIDAWRSDPSSAAIADDGDVCQPLLGIYPSGPPFQRTLIDQLKRGDHRWLSWLGRIPHRKVLLPAHALLNANCPADLATFSA